jgi:hypothetical protein
MSEIMPANCSDQRTMVFLFSSDSPSTSEQISLLILFQIAESLGEDSRHIGSPPAFRF